MSKIWITYMSIVQEMNYQICQKIEVPKLWMIQTLNSPKFESLKSVMFRIKLASWIFLRWKCPEGNKFDNWDIKKYHKLSIHVQKYAKDPLSHLFAFPVICSGGAYE